MRILFLLIAFVFISCSSIENHNSADSKVERIKGKQPENPDRGAIRIDTIKISNPFLDVYITDPIKGNSTFVYCVKESSEITIEILDEKEDLLYTMNTEKPAGEHFCYLNTFDLRGKEVPEGDYYIKVIAESRAGKTYKELVRVTVIN